MHFQGSSSDKRITMTDIAPKFLLLIGYIISKYGMVWVLKYETDRDYSTNFNE